jgi:hypothetical protein
MEQWSNRRPDQPTEDTEAVDVRPCRNGAASGTNAAVQIVSSTQFATDPVILRKPLRDFLISNGSNVVNELFSQCLRQRDTVHSAEAAVGVRPDAALNQDRRQSPGWRPATAEPSIIQTGQPMRLPPVTAFLGYVRCAFPMPVFQSGCPGSGAYAGFAALNKSALAPCADCWICRK